MKYYILIIFVSISLTSCGYLETYGERKYESGASYEGELKFNKPHGQGILTTAEGNIYKCSFIEGTCQGEAEIILLDGRIYKGNLIDGSANGQGGA